jgi:hypothetical protein
VRTPRARCLLVAIPLAALALIGGGCGAGSSEVEAPEGSLAAARKASAGPLGGLVGRLEAEDDATEERERAEQAPESVQERAEGREEEREEEARRREAEEQALEEEAHVGANGADAS